MNSTYNQSLFRWIADRNEAWLQQEGAFLSVDNSSQIVTQREQRNIRAIRTTQNERGLLPLRRESHILSLQNRFYPYKAEVSLLLRTNTAYCILNEVIEEAIEENVLLYFIQTNTGWKIDDVCYKNKAVPSNGGCRMISVRPDESPRVFNQGSRYNRTKAVQYAEKWWNSHNPAYRYFGLDDCTSFISQCLLAGGIPMKQAKSRGRGWWYRGPKENWSFSWAVAHGLANYLTTNKSSEGPKAQKRSQAKGLEIGDVICYDWQGDGRWDHNTIVTKIDPNGEPLVNAHSKDSQHRYWKYTDSHAYIEGKTKYAFFHILN